MAIDRRLRSSADIRAVVARRAAAGTEVLVVHAKAGDPPPSGRATVVAGKRVGGAVRRNRAKRRLRAALAEVGVPVGFDVVITAKSGADVVPYDQLVDDLRSSARRATRRAALVTTV